MILEPEQIKTVYRRLAPYYDGALIPLQLLGSMSYRRRAIEALRLEQGDTVLDLGCGTGVNLPLLSEKVGPTGRVIGVDLSTDMLAQAARKVRELKLHNVTLVEKDIREYEPEVSVSGVISTYALEMVPEHEELIEKMTECLTDKGHMALLGLKHPESWPSWLVELGIWLTRPFGVNRAYESIRPFESMQTHLDVGEYTEFLMGAAYLCVAKKHRI